LPLVSYRGPTSRSWLVASRLHDPRRSSQLLRAQSRHFYSSYSSRLAGRLVKHEGVAAAIVLLWQRLVVRGGGLRLTIVEARLEGLGHIDVGAVCLTFLRGVLQLLRHLHVPGQRIGARFIGTGELEPDIDRHAFAHGSGDNLRRFGLLSKFEPQRLRPA